LSTSSFVTGKLGISWFVLNWLFGFANLNTNSEEESFTGVGKMERILNKFTEGFTGIQHTWANFQRYKARWLLWACMLSAYFNNLKAEGNYKYRLL
jgi:hypothetical protein